MTRRLAWLAWLSLASGLVALVEHLLTTIVVPATSSSLSGGLQTWASSAGILLLVTAPIALFAPLLEHPRVTRALPSLSTVSSGLAVGIVTAALLRLADPALQGARIEFDTESNRAIGVAIALLIAASFLIGRALERVVAVGLARQPGAARRVRLVLAIGGAATALTLARWAFGPLHLLALAAGAVWAAVILTSIALREVVEIERPRDAKTVPIVVLVVGLLGLAAPWGREEARYTLHNHSSVAWFVEGLQRLTDLDGDAAAGSWALGVDCDDRNAAVGPAMRETPADGVDQDCRGGDARRPPPARPAAVGDCKPPRKPLSVLYLVVDALRPDAIVPEVMPATSSLARTAWVFERAYSPTAMTATSTAATFAARPFSDVGAANPVLGGPFSAPFTLAERFTEAGHRAIAFSDYLLYPISRRGFAAMNPHWRDDAAGGLKTTLTSAATSRGVLDALFGANAPVFVWAHISDTHAPYKLDRGGDARPSGEREAYLAGAAYVDRQLAILFGEIEARGRAEDTIIVVSADHGEELLEHGGRGHGASLYEESIRVPLIVRVPGCPARRITHPVVTTGVGPTLGALTGIEIPGVGLFEQQAGPVVVEGPSGFRRSFSRAVIGKRHKLIVGVNGGSMLFDLAEDPAETTGIDDPAARAELEAAYQAWLDAPGAR